MEMDIIIDSLTNCLICRTTGKEHDTEYFLKIKTVTEQDARILKSCGWKFDWSIPHKNGYEIYELLLEGDDEIQGMCNLQQNLVWLPLH